MRLNFTEKMIFRLFQTEPFHNLYQYHGLPIILNHSKYGGTCSIKTLSGKYKLSAFKHQNINAQLHESIVHFNNQSYDHRLLKITLQGKIYFADIGNAWPSIKLLPADKQFRYQCYGIQFHSIPCRNHLKIYQNRNGQKLHYLTIPFLSKPEHHLRCKIKQVVNQHRAPNKEIRFAQIIDSRFLFLRGNKLEIYHRGKRQELDVTHQKLADILHDYFRFDLRIFLKNHHA